MFMRRAVYLLITILFLCSKDVLAQCSQFPADCPSDRQLPDSADRLSNPLIPEEVSMEIRLHDALTDMMQKLAEEKQWEVYQFDESDGSGYLNASRSAPLEAGLRPPHDYEIAFIFIVSKDSLQAWRNWYNGWVIKMQEEAEKLKSSAGGFESIRKMQSEKKIKDENFRNASMVRVKFELNPESAMASSVTEDFHLSEMLNVPHSSLAQQWHNTKTDERAIFDLDQYKRCTDLAFVLIGDWNPKPDQDQRYHPQYAANKKNTDLVSPKSTPSYKVRTIALHVEGSPKYIRQFLQALNVENLNAIMQR